MPRFNSITGYYKAIEEGNRKLDDLAHKQFQAMLKNDVPGMNVLDKQYKDTERYVSSLKAELGEVMGAGIHGQKGNQLTGSGWFGQKMGELSAGDTAAKRAELGDETDQKGVTSYGGGYADFFREQREGENYEKDLEEILAAGEPNREDDTSSATEIWSNLSSWSGGRSIRDIVDQILEQKGGNGVEKVFFEQGGPLALLKQNYGTANVDGKDIPLAVSSPYEDLSKETKEVKTLSFNMHDIWKSLANFKTSAGKRYNPDNPEYYAPGQGGVAGFMAALDIIGNILNGNRRFDITVKTLDIDGNERLVIEYFDSEHDLINAFGPGISLVNKRKEEAGNSGTYYARQNKDYQYIDEARLNNRITGYIYVQDGRMVLKPVRFLKDKIVRGNKDMTALYFQPCYLDKDAALLVDAKLKEQGIDLGLDLSLYE